MFKKKINIIYSQKFNYCYIELLITILLFIFINIIVNFIHVLSTINIYNLYLVLSIKDTNL